MTPEGKETRYWDAVAGAWQEKSRQSLWRDHSDAVHVALLARWLPDGRVDRLLKTDLFDEAFNEGLYPLLGSRAHGVIGIDISSVTLPAALLRHSGLKAAWADVRRLPFTDEAFDIIVSNSTLDHFVSLNEMVVSLRELRRVLRPGGKLLLTLDNLANPVVALRNMVPFPLLNRLGLVPYYVGATCGPCRLQRILKQVGFEVLEVSAVMHCPRVFAVAIARMLEKRARPETQRRFLRFLMAFERLSRWPTRFLTGHFVAVRAVKR